jgi:hypothetical protein
MLAKFMAIPHHTYLIVKMPAPNGILSILGDIMVPTTVKVPPSSSPRYQIVDSTAGIVLLCFLDCYSEYHQIALHPDDEDKTTFITPHDIYCYKVMTFGLKTVEQHTRRQYRSASSLKSGRMSRPT